MCYMPAIEIVVLKTDDELPGRKDEITMAHPALLAHRPRSGRGFTLSVLMLLATVVAIGAIAFAAVQSALP